MNNLKIEIDEKTLKRFIADHFQAKLGDVAIEPGNVTIETKSKQNFRSEWEIAAFRATVQVSI